MRHTLSQRRLNISLRKSSCIRAVRTSQHLVQGGSGEMQEAICYGMLSVCYFYHTEFRKTLS